VLPLHHAHHIGPGVEPATPCESVPIHQTRGQAGKSNPGHLHTTGVFHPGTRPYRKGFLIPACSTTLFSAS